MEWPKFSLERLLLAVACIGLTLADYCLQSGQCVKGPAEDRASAGFGFSAWVLTGKWWIGMLVALGFMFLSRLLFSLHRQP
jgi:hypothetical protein